MTPSDRLVAHLRSWLGAWPPGSGGLTVVGSPLRSAPGWDGAVRPVTGVATPEGAVLSVPPEAAEAVRAAAHDVGDDIEALGPMVGALVGRPTWRFSHGIFRWSEAPTPGRDPGVWVPTDDPRLPAWLRPFNGDVLVAFAPGTDGEPVVAAGVGRKQHDAYGHELAVQTEDGFRGQGWARELVTQAARRVLADGAVPTYLHAPTNHASARTADASGFPDLGWKVLGLFGGDPG
jgi:GNAT superfamily N-acetyltransferase